MIDKNSLDVRDYGAKGDGKTDDTHAIQAALDGATCIQGTVFVPAGLYLCGELKMAAGVGIQGQSTWSFRDNQGSVLRLIDPKAKCLINLTGAYGAIVNGVCLDGGKIKGAQPIHGILVDKPDYGTQEDTPLIDSCRVSGFSGDGIRLERIWCFRVRHSQCYGNEGCGLRVRGWDGFILDNWFSGNGMAGYGSYEENASNTLTGNRIEWNKQGGIVIFGGNHYNITGNYVDRSGRCGIMLQPCGEKPCEIFAITGNVIFRSGKPDWDKESEFDSSHVRFEHVKGLVFSGNSMNAGRDDGGLGQFSPNYSIVIRSLENSVIKDNVMHHGSLKELIVDHGEHGPNVIVKDNVGSLREV